MTPGAGGQDLAVTATRGVFWTGGGQAIKQVIQIVTSVTLARLLLPEDFGLLGMSIVFVGVAQLFVDFGIGSALVQARDPTPIALSSSFWANVAAATLCAGAVALAAPLVADFYGDPRVMPLVATLSVSLLLAGLSVVPNALLMRAMDFSVVARAQVLGSLAGAATAVGLAWGGWGVWSLIAQPIVGSSVSLAVAWLGSGWVPMAAFSWQSITGLVRFSGGVLGSSLLNYANRNVDSLLIGRLLGETALGYYSLAYQIMLYPLSQVSSVIVRVLFPTLSQLQDDPERFKRAYLKSVSMIAMLTFPMMLGLLAVSHDFVLVVLGEKWLPMETVLQVFCLIGLVQSVATTVGTIYLSTGSTRQLFLVSLIATPVVISSFVIGVQWGIIGVATAYAVATGVLFYVSLTIALRLGKITLREWHRTVAIPMQAAVFMAVVVWWVSNWVPDALPGALRLSILVLSGAAIYAGVLWAMSRRELLEITVLARAALGRGDQ